jgi:hypothetical protein
MYGNRGYQAHYNQQMNQQRYYANASTSRPNGYGVSYSVNQGQNNTTPSYSSYQPTSATRGQAYQNRASNQRTSGGCNCGKR